MDQFLLLLALVIVIITPVFLQKRRADKLKASLHGLQASLTPGLPVVTTGGLHAIVDGVDEIAGTVDLVIAPGVVATYELQSVIKVQGANLPGIEGLKQRDAAQAQQPGDGSRPAADPDTHPEAQS